MDSPTQIDFGAVAHQLGLPTAGVQRAVEMLDDGNTVPFITRYRRDQTGGLNEERIRHIQSTVNKIRALEERKRTILKSIRSREKLTPELEAQIVGAGTAKVLEDLYLPFKIKKRTRAMAAREKGLEPLAERILNAASAEPRIEELSAEFVDAEKELPSSAEVITGTADLIAERFSENIELRQQVREIILKTSTLVVSKMESQTESKELESASLADPPTVAANEPSSSDAPATTTETPAAAETPETANTPTDDPPAPAGTAADPSTETPSSTDVQKTADTPGTEANPTEPDDLSVTSDTTANSAADSVATIQDAKPSGQSETPPTSGRENATAAPARPTRKKPQTSKKLSAAEQRRIARKQARHQKRKRLEASFADYFKFTEKLAKLPPHRTLAINRGERVRVLRVKLNFDTEAAYQSAQAIVIPTDHPHGDFLRETLRESLTRLVFPSLDREIRRDLTEQAEQHAVNVFSQNLRKLLLQRPVPRRVLAIDPGFRSGCKVVALDEFGNVLDDAIVNVLGDHESKGRDRKKLAEHIRKHRLTVIAIGNGTACRETEQFVAHLITEELPDEDVSYTIVNEAGASVYSTSVLAGEELPKLDATVRGAVSIGRRLLDPLSELVKIEPGNMGVGLYQHDVKAKPLQNTLDDVVQSCVNFVGVDINTASPALLRYVSGLNQLTARRIYEHRREHGPFTSREQIKSVAGIGEATYVQAAGFLHVNGGDNPLDATPIHPESYAAAEQILQQLGGDKEQLANYLRCRSNARLAAATVSSSAELGTQAPTKSSDTLATTETSTPASPSPTIEPDSPVTEPESAEQPPTQASHEHQETAHTETLRIQSPAADQPTESVNEENPIDSDSAESSADNAHADSSENVANSKPTWHVHDNVAATNLDELATQLGLGPLLVKDIVSALARPGRDPRDDIPPPLFRREIMKLDDLQPGMELAGTVLNVVDFGAFVDVGLRESGLVHISRLADKYIEDPHELISVGDHVRVWVVDVDKNRRRVSLTAIKPGQERPKPRGKRPHGQRGPQPRGGRRDGDRQGGRRRRQDQRRGGGAARPPRKKPPPKPVVPITDEMKTGSEPMRTFGDLKQFFEISKNKAKSASKSKPAKQSKPETTDGTDSAEG